MSTRDALTGQKTRAEKKKAASGYEAAKFREETPRKGGGFAEGSAIPRCNNMIELPGGDKSKKQTP
ncbi:MAG TPA: hypothetical protein VGP01_07265 [Rhizomicrobium sp.]|nr:hypothetical protein [Rhizomicrobium sp.]